ncbi:Peroxiredoxin [Carnobacterium iners]|uniref:Peroxiredoxin n=1 Tax=Carnobacterium iners TaxID=1073423 RepID=A0A1X7MZ96_9LACT|nr:TlpA disulfide reductase family protein [Carnobacterium iners]SEK20427.1 Peroxiredoxin [Carnobacterium iners]SMH30291.1 Peroxiredoxin [Carnobacterium iners]
MKKIIWAILGLVLIFVLVDFGYDFAQERKDEKQAASDARMQQEESQSKQVLEEGNNSGQLAYEFEAEDMAGSMVKLSDYRGKKVFLNFWASWCPPCKVEMPHLKEFSETQEDVVVLGVNVTTSETDLANAQLFLDEFDVDYPNVYGTQKMFNLYRVQSLPTSYIIDSQGVIQERIVGPVTKDVLTTKFDLVK